MDAPALLTALSSLVPNMQRRAEALDAEEEFPSDDIADLRRVGALAAPLPRSLGGLGAGTELEGALLLLDALRLIGRGHLAVARLFEAHVNAIRLIVRYGSPAQAAAAARDAREGHLFALWVTDPPGEPLILRDDVLHGRKAPCSGAGSATRAIVTVEVGADSRMASLALDGAEQATPLRGLLQGMRASVTGAVRFDGVHLGAASLLGVPGDYLREPDLSTGAWRTTAATLGGLEALIEAARIQLVARGHHAAPLQQERFGLAYIALETARLWTRRAAEQAENDCLPAADRVATVNLARIAVETAALDALRHVQRSLGLAAFVRPNPVERLARDLGTYLRQPAPDAVLTEAAAHMFGRPV